MIAASTQRERSRRESQLTLLGESRHLFTEDAKNFPKSLFRTHGSASVGPNIDCLLRKSCARFASANHSKLFQAECVAPFLSGLCDAHQRRPAVCFRQAVRKDLDRVPAI